MHLQCWYACAVARPVRRHDTQYCILSLLRYNALYLSRDCVATVILCFLTPGRVLR